MPALLDLVRKLIDYAKDLAATLHQRAAGTPHFASINVGTDDLALILARIARGPLRARAPTAAARTAPSSPTSARDLNILPSHPLLRELMRVIVMHGGNYARMAMDQLRRMFPYHTEPEPAWLLPSPAPAATARPEPTRLARLRERQALAFGPDPRAKRRRGYRPYARDASAFIPAR